MTSQRASDPLPLVVDTLSGPSIEALARMWITPCHTVKQATEN